MKPNTFFLVLFALLTYFATTLGVKAVVPPPDGGYPNFTTAEGQNALLSLTSGAANTAVGWFSLKSVTAGSFNTGVGAGTLVLNTGDENTAIGTAALLLNTASGNTAVGSRALLNNTTGGTLANIQGIDVGPNVAVGQQALESNTLASANTAVGYQALQSFATGPVGLEQIGLCTAVGFQALANATGFGAGNSAFGYQALMNTTDGGSNTAIGLQALFGNTTGNGNVANGSNALLHNDTGGGNVAVGSGALESNIVGDNNTAIGSHALGASSAGAALGANVAVGAFAGEAVTTASNVICIGTNVNGENVSDRCYIGSIYSNVQPIVGTDPDSVTINSNGRLGRGNVSSLRYKHDIKPMDKASEALYALKPVSFRYNKEYDSTQTLAYGLIAEEVAEVYPDLVGRNARGEAESVRYDQVNTMLLNEFLKEHRTVQDLKSTVAKQEATIAQQQTSFQSKLAEQERQIEALTVGLQKVSAQLELNKPAPQVVNYNQ